MYWCVVTRSRSLTDAEFIESYQKLRAFFAFFRPPKSVTSCVFELLRTFSRTLKQPVAAVIQWIVSSVRAPYRQSSSGSNGLSVGLAVNESRIRLNISPRQPVHRKLPLTTSVLGLGFTVKVIRVGWRLGSADVTLGLKLARYDFLLVFCRT